MYPNGLLPLRNLESHSLIRSNSEMTDTSCCSSQDLGMGALARLAEFFLCPLPRSFLRNSLLNDPRWRRGLCLALECGRGGGGGEGNEGKGYIFLNLALDTAVF